MAYNLDRPMPASDLRLRTALEVAELLRVTPRQLLAFCRSGELSYVDVGRGPQKAAAHVRAVGRREVHRPAQADGPMAREIHPQETSPFCWYAFECAGRRFRGPAQTTAERVLAEARDAAEEMKRP